MKRRRVLAALLSAAAGAGETAEAATAKAATPEEVAAHVPGAQLVGSGRLTFLGLHVYDARLWAGAEFKAGDHATAPLALELEYARSIDGAKIAERSLDEMKRGGPVTAAQGDQWLAAMKRLFPDVKPGDRLTGVQLPGGMARFFTNGKPIGELRDAEFTRRFFGIWLAPTTSEPKLRVALLGGA